MKLPNDMDRLDRIALFAPATYERARKVNEDALKRRYEELKSQAVSWDESRIKFHEDLVIKGESYKPVQLFPGVPVLKWDGKIPIDEKLRSSSADNRFHYIHSRFPAGESSETRQGRRNGHCWFNKPVVIPVLIRGVPGQSVRYTGGATTIMSCMPMEFMTQTKGVRMATGTVLVGGLGLGWFLRQVCAKKSVKRVILVEQSQAILDWLGPAIRAAYSDVASKVSDWICGDALDHLGKHGDDTRYLIDIWDTYRDYDRRFWKICPTLKHVWGWGQFRSEN